MPFVMGFFLTVLGHLSWIALLQSSWSYGNRIAMRKKKKSIIFYFVPVSSCSGEFYGALLGFFLNSHGGTASLISFFEKVQIFLSCLISWTSMAWQLFHFAASPAILCKWHLCFILAAIRMVLCREWAGFMFSAEQGSQNRPLFECSIALL